MCDLCSSAMLCLPAHYAMAGLNHQVTLDCSCATSAPGSSRFGLQLCHPRLKSFWIAAVPPVPQAEVTLDCSCATSSPGYTAPDSSCPSSCPASSPACAGAHQCGGPRPVSWKPCALGRLCGVRGCGLQRHLHRQLQQRLGSGLRSKVPGLLEWGS